VIGVYFGRDVAGINKLVAMKNDKYMLFKESKKIIQLVAITSLLLTSITSYACQCPQGGIYKFVKKLKKADFVAYVEVIGYDDIKDHEFDAKFTILKVTQLFQGSIQDSTVIVLDGGDVDCTHSLHYPIGTKFIIKAMIKSRKEYEFNLNDTPLSISNSDVKDPVLVLSICSETIIQVVDNQAIGFITEDRNKTKNPQSLEVRDALHLLEKRSKYDK